MSDLTPRAPGGGAVHQPAAGPLRADQVAYAHCRPVAHRRGIPPVGERVGLRMAEGGPVVAAVVVRVLGMEEPGPTSNPDILVWQVRTDERRQAVRGGGPNGYLWELRPDPWPVLLLRVDPVGGKGPRLFIESREERLSPYGGWLPAGEITEK